MIALRTVPGVLFALLLAACSGPPPAGEPCGGCPEGRECAGGFCVCEALEPACRLDCASSDPSCVRGTVDSETCTCLPAPINQLQSITVSPANLSLVAGDGAQLAASAQMSSGAVLDVTHSVTWASSDASVATVTEFSGVVTAVSEGTARISASSGPLQGEAVVTVTAASTQVDVAHDREFRGVWIATAYKINFPKTNTAAEQKAELVQILDTMAAYGLNAAIFQVRPESDAFYASDLEPWSRFLTGTQGQDPGYDPLAYLIREAHARNIEVHAWLNPYRALTSRSVTAVQPHVSKRFPEYAYPWGDALLWMDPGAEVVRQHIVNVVEDIVRRYDVDGIHFDDYFYPWPVSGQTFPDDATYQAHLDAGGTLSLADWRRDNVDQMIRRVGEAIAAEKPHVRFGVGPFGIYKSGEPAGISGTSQYDVLYSDPKKWMQQGWIDYLAPQLYWPTTQAPQAYGTLLPWWASLTGGRCYVFAGNALYRLGDSSAWTVDEFRQQVQIVRDHRDQDAMGNIFYHLAPLLSDRSGVATMLRDEFYAAPALTPPVVAVRDRTVAPPEVVVEGSAVTVSHDEPMRAWVVYAAQGDGWVIDRIIPAEQGSFTLGTGTWAISAASPGNVESKGVVVEIAP